VSRLHEAVTDALAYWERRRIAYNGVLAAIVFGYFAANLPHSWTVVSVDGVLFLFLLAVLANVCYCAAYVGDVFVQLSGFRESWKGRRWILLLIGTTFAAVITRFFVIGFFADRAAR